MNIKLIAVGKTDNPALQQLISTYEKRLSYYINFELQLLPDIKNSKSLSEEQQKIKEGELILSYVEPSHHLILLDERGKEYTSIAFADELQKKMNTGIKQLTFVIGGPYGFSQAVYQRANSKLSLSKLTFSHQMIRLFFTEQIYRSCTIIKGEPYHHE